MSSYFYEAYKPIAGGTSGGQGGVGVGVGSGPGSAGRGPGAVGGGPGGGGLVPGAGGPGAVGTGGELHSCFGPQMLT